MTALARDEIIGGTVVQLDADGIRKARRSKTNAEKTGTEDRAVEGEQPFLILKVDAAAGTAWLAPIFSGLRQGSEGLREDLKSGYPGKWLGVPLFFNKWQHWQIPLDDIVSCSTVEDTPQRNRRIYAATDPAELERILEFSTKNRAPWRSLT